MNETQINKIIEDFKKSIRDIKKLTSLELLAAKHLLVLDELEFIMNGNAEYEKLCKIMIQKNKGVKDQQMFDKKIDQFQDISDSYVPKVEIIQDLSIKEIKSKDILSRAKEIAISSGYIEDEN